MTIPLTRSRMKRIRRSDAAGIAWMFDREHYWSEQALREILKRIQAICHEDVEEALAASQHALGILNHRMVNPSPDLRARALAIRGTALRCNGKLTEALKVYEEALRTDGLTALSKNDVLARMAVTLVHLDRIEEALAILDEAVDLVPQEPLSLSLRGWAHMESGNIEECIQDCLAVINQVKTVSCSDHPFLAAIVNATNLLSYEVGAQVDASVFAQLQNAISLYRAALPKSGSNYYKTQNLRFVLSRAQALLLARLGKAERATSMLERAVAGLRPKFPDDALSASIDLMYLLAKQGKQRAAAAETQRVLSLAREARFPPPQRAVRILQVVATQSTLSALEASELRMTLRLREPPTRTNQQVA